jgi:hypothetical protein
MRDCPIKVQCSGRHEHYHSHDQLQRDTMAEHQQYFSHAEHQEE